MKKAFIIILMCALLCTACSKDNNVQSVDEVVIDKNVDSLELLENLDAYVEYTGEIVDNNKVNITFTFKEDVIVPENPPTVEAKIYLWKDNHLVGIYNQPLYNSYEDFLDPVTLNFNADGELFNRYEVSFNAASAVE